MGASMSSTFLYKLVSTVEVISSLVITIFGVNTFLLFHQMDDEEQTKWEMIKYSAIVAIAQSVLAILAAFFLVGCHFSSLQEEVNWAQQQKDLGKTPIGRPRSLRRKAIAPMWISWALISIASLLFVFISPVEYCLRKQEDVEDMEELGSCYSPASSDLMPIRNSLRDLYSYSIVGILFKALFVLMMYRNWKREQERAKKVIIYVDVEPASTDAGGGSLESPGAEPKIIISPSCPSSFTDGTTATTGINENSGVIGDPKEIISEKK